jgi:hypothetical protein
MSSVLELIIFKLPLFCSQNPSFESFQEFGFVGHALYYMSSNYNKVLDGSIKTPSCCKTAFGGGGGVLDESKRKKYRVELWRILCTGWSFLNSIA